MKQLFLILLFIMLCRLLLAPEARTFFIEKAKAIDPYKWITEAISWVESRHNDTIVNWHELAYGRYQIRKVRIDDYFNRTGIRYALNDMLDSAKAEKVFIFYARLSGWRNPEQIARKWNGGEERGMRYRQTKQYWQRVKKRLNNLQVSQ